MECASRRRKAVGTLGERKPRTQHRRAPSSPARSAARAGRPSIASTPSRRRRSSGSRRPRRGSVSARSRWASWTRARRDSWPTTSGAFARASSSRSSMPT